jgi:hypothetical protein
LYLLHKERLKAEQIVALLQGILIGSEDSDEVVTRY